MPWIIFLLAAIVCLFTALINGRHSLTALITGLLIVAGTLSALIEQWTLEQILLPISVILCLLLLFDREEGKR